MGNENQYFLMHHGIKGQKWGVRRFQNPDGTLTALGKARRRKDSAGPNGDIEKKYSLNNSDYLSRKQALALGEEVIKVVDDDKNFAKYRKKLDEMSKEEARTDERGDELASDILRDMGYDDNAKSRQFIKDHVFDNLEFGKEGSQGEKKSLNDLKNRSWEDLDLEIREKSGDWYFREGVSDNFKKAVKDYEDKLEKLDKTRVKEQKLMEEEDAIEDKFFADRDYDNKSREEQNRMVKDWLKVEKELDVYKERMSLWRKRCDAETALREEYEESLLGIVLNDLGYEDTKEAREYIRDVVIWD